jgi:hypothetical protein
MDRGLRRGPGQARHQEARQVLDVFAYDAAFTGGVHVAVADVDGTGPAEILTGAGPGGGPHVRIWKVAPGTGAVTGFGAPGYFAFAPGFTGGVTVAGGFFR